MRIDRVHVEPHVEECRDYAKVPVLGGRDEKSGAVWGGERLGHFDEGLERGGLGGRRERGEEDLVHVCSLHNEEGSNSDDRVGRGRIGLWREE